MRPIELSRKRSNGDLQRIYCNPAQIEYFFASRDEHETTISFGSGNPLHVTETPEQIIGRLADHRSTMRAEEHDGIVTYR